jgi:hypothetical protein
VLRKMKDVNLALISKLGWKLVSNSESLWTSQLKGKYLRTGSFLSLSPPPPPPSLPPHSFPFWLWKGILSSQSIISQGACHRVYTHSSFPIWNSQWIPTIPSFCPSPLSPSSLSSPLVVSDLINPNATWNTPLLLSLFNPQSVREIQKIYINPSPCPEFLWTPSTSGNFSTSSAYSLISNPRVSSYPSPLDSNSWKHLWKLKLNARLKLFLWKIAWDIIPTKARLKSIFPISSAVSLYPLCKVEEDSLPHLFFKCCFAKIAWRSSFWPLDSLAWASLTLPNWIKGITTPHASFGIPKFESHLFQIYAAVLCDLLWFSRDKAHHEGIISDISILAS